MTKQSRCASRSSAPVQAISNEFGGPSRTYNAQFNLQPQQQQQVPYTDASSNVQEQVAFSSAPPAFYSPYSAPSGRGRAAPSSVVYSRPAAAPAPAGRSTSYAPAPAPAPAPARSRFAPETPAKRLTFPTLPKSTEPVVLHEKPLLADFENDSNPELDLGKDGAWKEFSVLFLSQHYGEKTLKPALEKKGFQVTWVPYGNTNLFLEHLEASNAGTGKRFDVVGFTSASSEPLQDAFKQHVIEAHRQGSGLFIYADNQPLTYHANLVLPEIAGCMVSGDDYGNQTLVYGSDPNEPGRFDKDHLVFAGVNSLYEGITLCYPCPVQLEGKSEPEVNRLETLATSTFDRPVIAKLEANEGVHGRVILDCGFTKLGEQSWGGQERYVVNACVWLTNIEGRHGGVEPTAADRG